MKKDSAELSLREHHTVTALLLIAKEADAVCQEAGDCIGEDFHDQKWEGNESEQHPEGDEGAVPYGGGVTFGNI